ncbi:unnamed protein product [Ceratitis capitata]|uniref:(Mediterranean fruit fly) hypothetical protein n=1 Tax=Ceratitis capitata TaxID=7213 RepID=A0A811UGC2_CERCA|nr:unnamed protein product [Ceratitis capitata]
MNYCNEMCVNTQTITEKANHYGQLNAGTSRLVSCQLEASKTGHSFSGSYMHYCSLLLRNSQTVSTKTLRHVAG